MSLPPFRKVNFVETRVDVERRDDGSVVLENPHPMGDAAANVIEPLKKWAAEKPDQVWLAKRRPPKAGETFGEWETVTFAEAYDRVRRIAQALIDRGAVAREAMSMQAIRRWLAAAKPEDARALRETNPSYVFFRPLTVENPGLGPLGSEGVQLTPGRSLAVDRRFHPMGAPVWVEIEGREDEAGDEPPLRQLFIAQDSGGAISGPVRGDIFFGAGDEAGDEAGAFNIMGDMYVLTPAPVAARLAAGAP